jgi:dihydropteroate synthase
MVSIVGIVNCTPDSFSDGDGTLCTSNILTQAARLIDEGADILDIGGDSTRPGSVCVGAATEWARIAPVIEFLAPRIPCSVDTHHYETARRALDCGAKFINDISGNPSPEMIETIKRYDASYIAMFNPHGGPHLFGAGISSFDAVETISRWMSSLQEELAKNGIPPSKVILDPGMGAFVSRDPSVSWSIIDRIHEFRGPPGGILIGCSRKGFLAKSGEQKPSDRDQATAICGAIMAHKLGSTTNLFLRVHNPGLQQKMLREWQGSPSLDEISGRLV